VRDDGGGGHELGDGVEWWKAEKGGRLDRSIALGGLLR
jgi:hypothetical protein